MIDGEYRPAGPVQGEESPTSDVSWSHLLDAHRGAARKVVNAIAWMESFASFTKAVRVSCDDGNDYVIKGNQTSGRTIVTDHVLGQLGRRMGAPVSEICQVYVPQELIEGNRNEMGHIPPGLAHGSLYISKCYPAPRLIHYESPINRPRFASLAIFFGWSKALDRQLCYESPDFKVHSFDHGHFLPNGPLWDRGHLEAEPDPTPDPELIATCHFDADELGTARAGLQSVDRTVIADVISSVPDGWGGVNLEDMKGLAEFLDKRRHLLVQ